MRPPPARKRRSEGLPPAEGSAPRPPCGSTCAAGAPRAGSAVAAVMPGETTRRAGGGGWRRASRKVTEGSKGRKGGFPARLPASLRGRRRAAWAAGWWVCGWAASAWQRRPGDGAALNRGGGAAGGEAGEGRFVRWTPRLCGAAFAARDRAAVLLPGSSTARPSHGTEHRLRCC
ncbi:hypothetical protein ZWY2020_053001 [Hordeum vulgare]|nr:hypothetical protein ZWY2020_053001 [Hordeum vulgare]